MRRRTAVLGLVVGVMSLPGCGGVDTLETSSLAARPPVVQVARAEAMARPVVVLDPGHQLGNRNFPRQVNRPVPDGRGGRKACNTTGTATNGGYPEATFTWRVALLVRERLRERGIRVVMTRQSNRDDRWGPCVDQRGRAGNRVDADLLLSIHADGSYARGARGFHVITAPRERGSREAALAVRASLRAAGLPVASYVAGGDGLDVRTDLATLNLSRVPAAMVELGNMRDRRDARRMTSPRGRALYARALARAVVQTLSDNRTTP